MRAGILLALLLGACAGPLQYDRQPAEGRSIVRTAFATAEQIKAICGRGVPANWVAGGCAMHAGTVTLADGAVLDSYILYVERPESFSDERRVWVLGAEMLKTLGATYQAPWSRPLK